MKFEVVASVSSSLFHRNISLLKIVVVACCCCQKEKFQTCVKRCLFGGLQLGHWYGFII